MSVVKPAENHSVCRYRPLCMYFVNNRNENHTEIGHLNLLSIWMSLLLLISVCFEIPEPSNCFGILVVQSVLEISKSFAYMSTKA